MEQRRVFNFCLFLIIQLTFCVWLKDPPANGTGSKLAAASQKEESSESLVEEAEKDGEAKDEEMKSTEEMGTQEEPLGENRGAADEDRKEVLTNAASDSTPDSETPTEEASAVKNVTENTEERTNVDGFKDEDVEMPVGEETKQSGSVSVEASMETTMPELPKVKCPADVCARCLCD